MVGIKAEKKRRPGVGLAVILMKNNQVLLGKRKGSHGAGTWAFPGGHLEFYEEFRPCVEREITEETGLKAGKNFRLIDMNTVKVTNDIFKEENKHYVTLFMRAEYLSGVPVVKEKDKCEGWEWFYWNGLERMGDELFIPVKNLIKQGYNPFKD